MKRLLTLSLVCAFACSGSAQALGPEAALTVKARDGLGNPVQGARVAVYADVFAKNKVLQNTNAHGVASGSVRTLSGSLFYGVRADGFYGVNGEYRFNPDAMKGDSSTWSARRWEPWNPTVELVLKEKGPLLPMFAKRIQIIDLPAPAKDIGYDLEFGDWVAPHGEGKTADLIFTGRGEIANGTYQLQWRFSNPGDGIRVVPFEESVRSELKSPKEAPAEDYAPSLKINWEGRVLGVNDQLGERPACFLIRVRTVLDEKGTVVSAHYGKIYPEQLNVVYYLNPKPNSRSLEYDPARNLLGKLPGNARINDY